MFGRHLPRSQRSLELLLDVQTEIRIYGLFSHELYDLRSKQYFDCSFFVDLNFRLLSNCVELNLVAGLPKQNTKFITSIYRKQHDQYDHDFELTNFKKQIRNTARRF